MIRVLRRLYELSPKEVIQKTRARLGLVDPEELLLRQLLDSNKAMRTQWLYDFLSRYEAILAQAVGWQPLDFEGRAILELGAGPLLGWGPLAIYRGATQYCGVDPTIMPSILWHPELEQRYLHPLYKDLRAVYGERMSFAEFTKRLDERVLICPTTLLDANISGAYDVVLSNSCLEHVSPLIETVVRLKRLSSNEIRFLHLVDFGNHRTPQQPFAGIYEASPEQYIARHGNGINLLRPSDLFEAFRQAGFTPTLVPYYSADVELPATLDPHWRQFDRDELCIKAAILAGST